MKPKFQSKRLFGITRAKGKMYEFGLPESSHIAVPNDAEPSALFLLTVGTLGDMAAEVCDSGKSDLNLQTTDVNEVGFSASFFDAFLASRFSEGLSNDVMLLAAAAYYLAQRPGSSLVLAKQLTQINNETAAEFFLRSVLQSNWLITDGINDWNFRDEITQIIQHLSLHFNQGADSEELSALLDNLRNRAYKSAISRDLLFIDVAAALVHQRLAVSSWNLLPNFTQIPAEKWTPVIQRPDFPKEMWPSQVLLGKAGVFSGTPAVIQMPTSAGKTRSVEITLRSGFLSGRARLALVVAPFRALCHEIATSLRHAFKPDEIKVNEISDALQIDFLEQIAEFFGTEIPNIQSVLILTPEKLLYMLRQVPALINDIGIVVYDEGHQFDSGSRGITYELLLAEIKSLLPEKAQTILVSAVIRNAEAVGSWLIGEDVKVVDGVGLLPTARSIAFASWLETRGQLFFFESDNYTRYDYFVPRVIEQEKLERFPKEKVDRYFPEKDDDSWKDIAIYLGIRLSPNGAVAIFSGRKDTAIGMAERVKEIYARGYKIQPPATFSNTDEIQRLCNLIRKHFGEASTLYAAAALGVFVHHGNTPQGLRLAVEHAMQSGLIQLVICTSTLAQGVNLPIRYLIVSGIYQAGERIKTRDFQNLIGRAGRAGMHTEGLVLFADPRVIDNRSSERWRFDTSVSLLEPNNSEDTTSSLLTVLGPFLSVDRKETLPIEIGELCRLLIASEDDWLQWSKQIEQQYSRFGFTSKVLLSELRYRRRLLNAVESYLMANRGIESFEQFKGRVKELAASTLAFYLATDEQKIALLSLFDLVAENIESMATVPESQAIYAKTLLGVNDAIRVENWVNENRAELLVLESNEDWLIAMWPLFCQQLDDKFFNAIAPASLPIELAKLWLQGESYQSLIEFAKSQKGTKPWGESKRRQLVDADIIDFCENTLGFDCSLALAAASQFLFGDEQADELSKRFMLFQKSLKYGLPDWLSISCFERGFADRVIALMLRDELLSVGYTSPFISSAVIPHRESFSRVLREYPTYFESVLDGIT